MSQQSVFAKWGKLEQLLTGAVTHTAQNSVALKKGRFSAVIISAAGSLSN